MEGQRLGVYEVGPMLGAGGMGTVYRARVVGAAPGGEPGDTVAIKVVHPHLLSRNGFLARFRREARVGRLVRHRNVVETMDLGSAEVDGESVHFLVMEHVEGRTLQELADELVRVPEALLREIGRQVADGLTAIHAAGIVHRDLKPANILITDAHRIRIMDLGVARLVEESLVVTQPGEFVGSLWYAAPEQFRSEAFGPAADLYSVGVLLYELATGRNPFARDRAAEVIAAHLHETPERPSVANDDLSPFLDEVIATLLAKEVSARPASAEVLRDIFQEGERSNWWIRRAALLRETTSELPPIPVRRDADLVGREQALEALHDAWSAAQRGAGTTVWLEGEPGIGKTRLIDAFVREIDPHGAHVLYGSYSPSGSAGALSDAIVSAFGSAELEHALRPYLEITPRLAAPFASLVRHESPAAGVEPLSAQAVHTVMCHLMRGLAAEKPLIWVVDDLHFAEPARRAMVLSLARALEQHRVLLLIGAQPGVPEDEVAHFSLLRSFRRLPVERLSPREVIELVRATVGSRELADRIGGQIAYKSDGVPLFALEMIREMEGAGAIRRGRDGKYESTGPLTEIDVPSAVRDLIRGRLRDLSDEERAVLDVAAVQGFEFDADLIARVRETKRVVVLERLASLERRSGVVRSAGGTCRFDHHQIQELLYQELMSELRAEYHMLLADALAAREGIAGDAGDAGELSGETAHFLASHHLRGAEPRRGVPQLLRALDHLAAVYRHRSALDLASAALERPALMDAAVRESVLVRKASNLDYLGRREEQRAALEEARQIADASLDPRRQARTRTELGWHLLGISADDEALAVLQEARAFARGAGDGRLEAAALGNLGVAHANMGRLEEARALYVAQLEIARHIGSAREEANALGNMGIVYRRLGRYDEARESYQQALALEPEGEPGRDEARTLHNLAILDSDQGRYDDAATLHDRALATFREIGDRFGEAAALGTLAGVARILGRLGDALEHRQAQRQLSREIGFRQGEAIALANLGATYTALGARDLAREALREAVELLKEIGARHAEGHAVAWLAELRAHDLDADGAERLFLEALALRRELRHPAGIADTQLGLGRLLLGGARPDEAASRLDEAISVSRELDAVETLTVATALRALLPGGDLAAALAVLAANGDRLRHESRMETRFALWRAAGDPAHLTHAKELLASLVAAAPAAYRDTMTQGVPLHQAITEAE